jgi:hypothetical protein
VSTWTNLRAPVRADLLTRVEEKATSEGRTVPEVVTELLTAYVNPATRTRAKRGI